MSDNRERLSALSVHLSLVLDDIGLNTLTVRRGREAHLFKEQYETFLARTIGKQKTVYYFGSKMEGTTTHGLNSDADGLICLDDFNIMQDMSDRQQDKINLLMLQEDTAPGYCRLQLLGPHVPNDKYIYDGQNRMILKNTCFHHIPIDEHKRVRNGPAQSCSLYGSGTTDIVRGFRCNSWPREAVSWSQKHRRGNWPEQSLIERTVRTGFFLVPVGYKLSESEDLEWRISLSLTERSLMFTMNMTQLKCYVVLKMIMKSLVIPIAGESISSYHCKTALFYCSEDTGTEFWVEDNIFQCIIFCLSVLLRWIRYEFCPHFIMSRSKIFAGKVNSDNKQKLLSVFEEMLASNGQFLFRISTDELGEELRLRCIAFQTRTLFIGYTMGFLLNAERNRVVSMDLLLLYTLLLHDKSSRVEIISLAYAKLAELRELIRHADFYERPAICVLTEQLSYFLGSLLASDSLSCQREIHQEALSLLHHGAKNDNANMVKLASVLFCDGLLEKAEEVLQVVESKYKRKCMHPVCPHTDYIFTDLEFSQLLLTQENEVERRRLFASCIVFSVHEIHCAPTGMRYELFRSVGKDSHQRSPIFDGWIALAVADFMPFLYYLQYLTYGLRKPDLQRRALHNLERCIKDNDNLGHLETAWNLLGQCMEAENNPSAALDCYRRSLVVQPRDNAANWHLSILVYREVTAT